MRKPKISMYAERKCPLTAPTNFEKYQSHGRVTIMFTNIRHSAVLTENCVKA